MAADRVQALKAERDDVVAFLGQLSTDEWAMPSRCEGWTIQDVVSHLSAAVHGTFTPWVVKLMMGSDVERSNDADAEKRRGREPAKVFREYEKWSKRCCGIQGLFQVQPVASLPIRVAEVGTYPARLLTSAFVFDTYVHLRHDMAPAVGRQVPPADAGRLSTTIEWMLTGMPTMTGDRLDWLDRPVELDLTGEGGGIWGISPRTSKRVTVTPGAVPDPGARIQSPAESFPIWGTRREAWRDNDVSVHGDEELGARFLDSLRII